MARLLEHDALALLADAGVAVTRAETAASPAEAGSAAERLGGRVVVKALIPTGGRGKAGLVAVADDAAAAAAAAAAMLGRTVLHFPVDRVLVGECLRIERELFASIAFDSMSRGPVVLFSAAGGVEVEEILAHDPARLVRVPVSIGAGLGPDQAREIADRAGLRGDVRAKTADALTALYRLFCRVDAETVEVNPLAVTADGDVVAPTGVIVVDDQALFRHPELQAIAERDRTNGWRPLTPMERRMREIDAIDASSSIRFNELEAGDIGFMCTGGGAGMLALDHMLRCGGAPATTFDITPGRIEEKMYLATKEVLSRPGLKGLIAGGNISNFIPVDVKVRGVVRALKDLGVDARTFPVVFRFAGPGVEESKRLAADVPGIEYLDETGTIEEAVERIVALTGGR